MTATTKALEPADPGKSSHRLLEQPLSWALVLTVLTAVMFAINGFHPLAEDGGLYVAGIEYRLDPALFPHYTAFVTEHLRFSLFATVMATAIRLTHVPLAWALLIADISSLWLTLYAGLLLLRRCTPSLMGQFGGIALLAVWSSLPIAGTSLMLVDPYLTARSFSTPLSLIALAFALDEWHPHTAQGWRSFTLCGLSLLSAALMHPLMAAYALAMVVLLRILRTRRALALSAALSAASLLLAAALHKFATPDTPAAVSASLSRYYWFLSQWQWYELCGLLGPVIILALLLRYSAPRSTATRLLAKAAILTGTVATLAALCFAHKLSTTYLLARLQPLRIFLLIYAVMILLLGASICEWAARQARTSETHKRWLAVLAIPAMLFVISGCALCGAQLATFPASQHVEWPFVTPVNPWSRAFIWARDNTPLDALFALDPDYITTDGEDAQTFRATSLRSAVPDFSKDGGEASITTSLAPLWQQSLAAQSATQNGTRLTAKASLSHQNDTSRDAHLLPLGVTWVVLHSEAPTAHPCPYNNKVVKVCRID
jgi:hypothetical protein